MYTNGTAAVQPKQVLRTLEISYTADVPRWSGNEPWRYGRRRGGESGGGGGEGGSRAEREGERERERGRPDGESEASEQSRKAANPLKHLKIC
jgi:hypothetical protein